ncbi:MAG: ribonuclease, partial [Massilia sp.]|nr:ribonuclease [Massilia sp.]
MNLFFEESGDFKVGTVLSQAGEAYQVEMPSGKRTKVKVKDVLLQYEKPAPAELLEAAKAIALDADLEFLWEVAGEEEFGFAELAADYFGHTPLPFEAAGLILALHGAPIYFYKKGRGRYKAAPEQSLRAAQAGIEKKKQQGLIQAAYVEELKAGTLPAAMRPQVAQLLFKPDKNSIEYKALETACNELHTSAPRLMLATGGIESAKALHMARFLFENFPRGAGFPAIAVPATPAGLPLADVAAFSIDDVTTTEIDDAFSVTVRDDGTIRVGIHIAAPGLAIKPDDAIDKMARSRMSTVYMPGDKITMLPDDVVEAFTLAEGRACPAISLYATLDANLTVVATETRAEMVPIAANLRHNDLDAVVNEETLASGEGEYPHKMELLQLWQWALKLEAGRMARREAFGLRPEQNNRVDYNFYVDDDVVSVVKRKRGAP